MSYLIVGESIAGVGAALEMAAMGHAARIILHVGDNNGLEDTFRIGPTPWNPAPMCGMAFADIVFDELPKLSIELRTTVGGDFCSWDHARVDHETGELVLDGPFKDEQHRFLAAIFAPNGSEKGLSRELEERFSWKGISYSAWSDAAFYWGKPVVVAGCGRHAFDQALIAAEFANSVIVICESRWMEPGLLTPVVEPQGNILIRQFARIVQLEPQTDGSLGSVVVEERGARWTLPAHGLFVASEPIVEWCGWGGEAAARELVAAGKLYLAGTAAGVPYTEHAALFDSGVLAARQCLASRRGATP